MVKFVPAQTWAAIVLLPAASNPRNYAGQFIAKCGVQDLLADSNPMVVANAVAALTTDLMTEIKVLSNAVLTLCF